MALQPEEPEEVFRDRARCWKHITYLLSKKRYRVQSRTQGFCGYFRTLEEAIAEAGAAHDCSRADLWQGGGPVPLALGLHDPAGPGGADEEALPGPPPSAEMPPGGSPSASAVPEDVGGHGSAGPSAMPVSPAAAGLAHSVPGRAGVSLKRPVASPKVPLTWGGGQGAGHPLTEHQFLRFRVFDSIYGSLLPGDLEDAFERRVRALAHKKVLTCLAPRCV